MRSSHTSRSGTCSRSTPATCCRRWPTTRFRARPRFTCGTTSSTRSGAATRSAAPGTRWDATQASRRAASRRRLLRVPSRSVSGPTPAAIADPIGLPQLLPGGWARASQPHGPGDWVLLRRHLSRHEEDPLDWRIVRLRRHGRHDRVQVLRGRRVRRPAVRSRWRAHRAGQRRRTGMAARRSRR